MRIVQRNRLVISATLALVLVLAQFAAIATGPGLAVRIVLPLTIALAPLALWPHRAHPGVWMMLVGLAANLAAILANGGLMPIERGTVERAIGVERASAYAAGSWVPGSKDVLVEDGTGRATALGDSIIVRIGSHGFAASPGDVVIWAGLLLLAGEAAVVGRRRGQRAGFGIAPHVAVGELHPQRAEGGAPSVS